MKQEPYFYIIKHVKTNRFYAGCKRGKDSNSDNLLKENGYLTSSKRIKNIIKTEGIESFEITKIIKQSDIDISVYDYETSFLKENNCSMDKNWFNCHNNTRITYGTIEHKLLMIEKYGVEFAIQSDIVKEKVTNTCLEKYGAKRYNQNAENKIKNKNSLIKKYNVINVFQLESVKEKSKATNIKNLGVEFAMQSVVVKEKSIKSCLEKYGVTHPNKLIENKKRLSMMATLQRSNEAILTCPFCCTSSKSHPNMKRYHFDNCKLNENSKNSIIGDYLLIQQKENDDRLKYTCHYCDKFIKHITNLNRWHNDNCKLKIR